MADDVFENHFYEALKHKATENYDLAINELNKCLSKSPENETVFYELGKNYFYAKNIAVATAIVAPNDELGLTIAGLLSLNYFF